MNLYGQYCAVGRAPEILADRWTPLLAREPLAGLRHLADLVRLDGMPAPTRAFPHWLTWSPMANAVRAVLPGRAAVPVPE